MSARVRLSCAISLILPGLTIGFDAGRAQEPAGCTAASESRWATADATYDLTAEFGRGAQQWLTGVAGVDYDPVSQRLVIYDGAAAQVRILTGDLAPVGVVGRKGEGPGELAEMPNILELTDRYPRRDLVSVHDSAIAVYDHRRLQTFGLTGRLMEPSGMLPRASSPLAGIRGVHALEGGRVVLGDIYRTRTFGQVRVYVLNEAQGSRQVASLDLGGRAGPSSFWGPQEAQPLWASEGSCVYVADGSSAFVLRINVDTSELDTLHLPAVDVEVRERILAPPMADLLDRSTAPPPERLRRWAQIAVDPDGHLWAEVYRHPGDPAVIVRVGRDNQIFQERLPSFPRAFGPPCTYYTVEEIPETGEQVLRRYTLTGG